MYKSIALAVIFVVGTHPLKCPTCRGEYCDNEIIYELDCTKFLTSLALPHGVYSEGHEEENSEYACMDLEYNLIGYDSMKIKQCFIIRRGRDVCGQIKKSLAKREVLEKCVVTLEEKGADDTTTTTTGVTTKTTPPTTTTEETTTAPSTSTISESTTEDTETATFSSDPSTVETETSETTTTINNTTCDEDCTGNSSHPHLQFLFLIFTCFIHRCF